MYLEISGGRYFQAHWHVVFRATLHAKVFFERDSSKKTTKVLPERERPSPTKEKSAGLLGRASFGFAVQRTLPFSGLKQITSSISIPGKESTILTLSLLHPSAKTNRRTQKKQTFFAIFFTSPSTAKKSQNKKEKNKRLNY